MLALCFVIGATIFTMILQTLDKNLSLDAKQSKVFASIHKTGDAAALIIAAYKYYQSKKKLGIQDSKTKRRYRKLLKKSQRFKKNKEVLDSIGSQKNKEMREFGKSIRIVEAKVAKLTGILNQLVLQIKT